jgi:prepilin-type N-terminal cleavage/methylation domain-containing protein
MKKNNKKGFTLIELLAVIVILAILATAAYTLIIPRINAEKPKTFVTDISNITDAYDMYVNTSTTAPTNSTFKIYTTTTSSTNVACKCVSIDALIENGNLKFTGNDKAKGIVAVCNNQYYVSYANDSYKTTGTISNTVAGNNIVNSRFVSPDNNMTTCSGSTCSVITSCPTSGTTIAKNFK